MHEIEEANIEKSRSGWSVGKHRQCRASSSMDPTFSISSYLQTMKDLSATCRTAHTEQKSKRNEEKKRKK